MPRRNRGTPLGEIIADPARGLVYANRGVLVDARGEIRRRFDGRRWIACRLRFKERRRAPLMAPGRYTELFFLDEATALAAGHRPCGECRYEDYRRFAAIWQRLHPGHIGADAMDRQLHAERVDPRTRGQLRHELAFGDLPDGTFVFCDSRAWLVLGDQLCEWTPAGYGERRPRGSGRGARAVVLTPPSLVDVLRAGWDPVGVPFVHPSAGSTAGVS
ncbi:MAG TPA: hypothetical protein VE571_06745 [Solirubrobacteraceae bacterium]|nr:hypothetical protein [Solirubrobacteraceae bacterium]